MVVPLLRFCPRVGRDDFVSCEHLAKKRFQIAAYKNCWRIVAVEFAFSGVPRKISDGIGLKIVWVGVM